MLDVLRASWALILDGARDRLLIRKKRRQGDTRKYKIERSELVFVMLSIPDPDLKRVRDSIMEVDQLFPWHNHEDLQIRTEKPKAFVNHATEMKGGEAAKQRSCRFGVYHDGLVLIGLIQVGEYQRYLERLATEVNDKWSSGVKVEAHMQFSCLPPSENK